MKIHYQELLELSKEYYQIMNGLYKLNTFEEVEIEDIYRKIIDTFIETKIFSPNKIQKIICTAALYNNRYFTSYLKIYKKLFEAYNLYDRYYSKFNLKFYKIREWSISVIFMLNIASLERCLDILSEKEIEECICSNITNRIHKENTIFNSILYDDIESFIVFTTQDEFNQNMKLTSVFYPKRYNQYILSEYSLIELCCYHGSVRCFKYLLSEFKSEITHFSLELSFLSGKPDIINECLKYQEPNYESMKYAIISHNIDFVCFLMNEYHLSIIDDLCLKFNNIQAFLILLDQTNEFSKCFLTMLNFRLKPLVKYFIQHGVKVNAIPRDKTTLKIAIKINCYDLFKYHVLNGACINGEYKNGRSPLHIAAKCNSIKILQSLISLGANINSKDDNGKTALHYAVIHNCKEAVELLISLDANIHLKDKDRKPAIHYAKGNNEIVKLLRSHKNDRYGLRHLSFCNIF